MSNYVWNRVVCRKEAMERWLADPDPFGDGQPGSRPSISFNRLADVKSVKEYEEKAGVPVWYEKGVLCREYGDGRVELKFCTLWQYPIRAIGALLELAQDTQWYAVEENHTYVSRFCWEDGLREDVLLIEDAYFRWSAEHEDLLDSLPEEDDGAWYFLPEAPGDWHRWESTDHFGRYRGPAAVYVEFPFEN